MIRSITFLLKKKEPIYNQYTSLNFLTLDNDIKKKYNITNPMILISDQRAYSFAYICSALNTNQCFFLPKIQYIYDFVPEGELIHFNKLSAIEDYEMQQRCKQNWDDKCQDKVLEHFYGENWQEFKDVLLKYQDAIGKKDISATFNYVQYL